MANRTLIITIDADWQNAMRIAAQQAFTAEFYQGEILNFETPSDFFGKLTARHWNLLKILQKIGEAPEHELARRNGYSINSTQEDIAVLVDLGLVERTKQGKIICPYADIHVDMHLRQAI